MTLREADVTLNLKTFWFFSDYAEYLAHIFRLGKLEIDQAHTQSLKTAKTTTTWSTLRAFLGLCNVYHLLIPDFTGIADPLSKLLR